MTSVLSSSYGDVVSKVNIIVVSDRSAAAMRLRCMHCQSTAKDVSGGGNALSTVKNQEVQDSDNTILRAMPYPGSSNSCIKFEAKREKARMPYFKTSVCMNSGRCTWCKWRQEQMSVADNGYDMRLR